MKVSMRNIDSVDSWVLTAAMAFSGDSISECFCTKSGGDL